MAIFEYLDRYLLDAAGEKAEVVRELLATRPGGAAAAPFYDGMGLLAGRTPDLSLMALRLVLAGKRADDSTVVRLREILERARAGDAAARDEYRAMLAPGAP